MRPRSSKLRNTGWAIVGSASTCSIFKSSGRWKDFVASAGLSGVAPGGAVFFALSATTAPEDFAAAGFARDSVSAALAEAIVKTRRPKIEPSQRQEPGRSKKSRRENIRETFAARQKSASIDWSRAVGQKQLCGVFAQDA